MPVTHVYRHEEEKGLGQHHADLEGREPWDKEAALAAGMAPEHAEIIDAEKDRQAKLDLAHGTNVEFDYIHPDTGLYHVTWTDFFGTPRMTSIEPEAFDAMFEPNPEYDGPVPTHSSVQEHDYHRGTFERPDHRPPLHLVAVPATGEPPEGAVSYGIVGAVQAAEGTGA